MSRLFSPFKLRELEIRNRVFVSPMCQYSSIEGMPAPWHLVHLGARAIGGAGLVMTEAVAVSPEGRISPWDLGLWSDEQARAFVEITRFLSAQGSVPAIQLAHAGRKASTDAPWRGGQCVPEAQGGWLPVAPSPLAFSEKHPVPRELTEAELERLLQCYIDSTRRSLAAGFQVVEIHMAHGYLLHEFLSPLCNKRTDRFGGALENRLRFPLQVAAGVRKVWPARLPLFVRISASDWVEGGWDIDQSIRFARRLKDAGIDFIDCSSGGAVPDARIPAGPGYQVPFAEAIRKSTGMATGAVGCITEPAQAEEILVREQADAVFLGREFLRNPQWPLDAARKLGDTISWPQQYERARLS